MLPSALLMKTAKQHKNNRLVMSQLPNTAERAVIKSLSTVQSNETMLGSSRKLGGAAERAIDG